MNILSSLVSRIAMGFNFRVRALIDSGSSHCFISTKICELNVLSPYAVDPVKLRYLDGSSSIINQQLLLALRFPSGDVQTQDLFWSFNTIGSTTLIR